MSKRKSFRGEFKRERETVLLLATSQKQSSNLARRWEPDAINSTSRSSDWRGEIKFLFWGADRVAKRSSLGYARNSSRSKWSEVF
jgi:hypothetical protein